VGVVSDQACLPGRQAHGRPARSVGSLSVLLQAPAEFFRDASAAQLLLRVGKLTARVLEEELAANRVDRREEIDKKNRRKNRDRAAVFLPKETPIGDQELAFLHQKETQRQKEDTGREQRVGDHLFSSLLIRR